MNTMNKMSKNAIILIIITLVAKVMGFFREMVLAYTYGAGSYTDAYLVALNIPNVVFAVIGTAIATTFIPIYCEVNNKYGKLESRKFTNNITTIVTVICILLMLMGLLFTDDLVKLFAIGFDGETFNIAVEFTRIMIIGIVFMGLKSIMTAYLQANENFTVTGIVSLPRNIIIIISMILSIKFGPYSIVYGTVIAIVSEFLIQVPFAIKEDYKYKLYVNFKDQNMKKVILLIAPVLLGVAVNQVNAMIDRSLATTLTEGSVSALNYANKLNEFILAMFVTAITTVIYPTLSKLNFDSKKEEFNKVIVNSVNIVSLFVIPISFGAIIFSKQIIEILFQRGEFNSIATEMTSTALVFYSIGLIAYALRNIVTKVFYSMQDTKTPIKNGILMMILNIILNIILINVNGIGGLALASSLSSIIGIILLIIALKRKIGDFGISKISKLLIQSIAGSIIMSMLSKVMYNIIYNYTSNTIIALFISVIIGVFVYFSIMLIMKVEEVVSIKNIVNINKKSNNINTRNV